MVAIAVHLCSRAHASLCAWPCGCVCARSPPPPYQRRGRWYRALPSYVYVCVHECACKSVRACVCVCVFGNFLFEARVCVFRRLRLTLVAPHRSALHEAPPHQRTPSLEWEDRLPASGPWCKRVFWHTMNGGMLAKQAVRARGHTDAGPTKKRLRGDQDTGAIDHDDGSDEELGETEEDHNVAGKQVHSRKRDLVVAGGGDGGGAAAASSRRGTVSKRKRIDGRGQAAAGNGFDGSEGSGDEDEDESLQRYSDDLPENTQDLADAFAGSQQDISATSDPPELAEAGVISKVDLENFLCHSKLTVNLGQNVNFIIGLNGSGKSAILTAITVGLGGKATTTNRGASMKDLIKTGRDYSKVSITLLNQGEDAFKPDLYGNVVTVERTFRRDGGSSYKLIGADRKTKSKSKDELTALLDQHNIQVDNPVAVLNQDQAKSFITSSKPKDKYRFFRKATQLEQMNHDYVETQESVEIIKRHIEEKRSRDLPTMKSELAAAERRYRQSKKTADAQAKLAKLQQEVIWAEINEKDAHAATLQLQFDREDDKRPKIEEKAEACKAAADAARLEQEAAEAELQSMTTEVNEVFQRRETLKAAHRAERKHIKQLETEMFALSRELDGANAAVQKQENLILVTRQESHRDYEEERVRRAKQIEATERKLQMVRGKRNELVALKEQLTADMTRIRADASSINNDVKELEKVLSRARRDVQALMSAKTNQLRVYGDPIVKLVARLPKIDGFHAPPIGPLGTHIRVKDERWAPMIEAVLKGNESAFAVTDSHDYQLLKKVCAQMNVTVAIVVMRFSPNRYTGVDADASAARTHFPTVMDMIDIDHPQVFNVLIDQCSIHQHLLIADKAEGRRVMWEHTPARTKSVRSLEGDEFLAGRRGFIKDKQASSSRKLITNFDKEIEQRRAVVEEKTQELEQRRADIKHLNTTMGDKKKQAAKLRADLSRLEKQVDSLESESHELSSQQPEAPPDIETMEEDLAEKRQAVDEVKSEIDVGRKRVAEAKKKLEPLAEELAEIQRANESSTERTKEVSRRIAAATDKINEAEHKYEKYRKRLQEFQSSREAALREATKAAAEVEDLKSKAAEKSVPFVETRRPLKTVETELRHTKDVVERQQKKHGNPVEIARDFQDKRDRYEQAEAEILSHEKLQKYIHRALSIREKAFTEYCRYVAMRTKTIFGLFLSKRHFTGKMEIDHHKQELTLRVAPDANRRVDQAVPQGGTETSALSGGERSFSTVAFIMALWEAMECPFRALDEFDVHMDMINRRVSMKLLLETAAQQRNRQFILLTPQHMSKELAVGVKDIKTFKLPDPQRNQRTLEETLAQQ
eukprot:m.423407 g.423407  ORF g.423407 m.423407 type:complete len:1329 (+) comp20211_c2_seq3:397-4383(+)